MGETEIPDAHNRPGDRAVCDRVHFLQDGDPQPL